MNRKWTPQQKLLHDMKLLNAYEEVRRLIGILAGNDRQKVGQILAMINDLGIEESYNILSNQMMIMNQDYDDVIVLGKINNAPKLKEWYTRVPSNY